MNFWIGRGWMLGEAVCVLWVTQYRNSPAARECGAFDNAKFLVNLRLVLSTAFGLLRPVSSP